MPSPACSAAEHAPQKRPVGGRAAYLDSTSVVAMPPIMHAMGARTSMRRTITPEKYTLVMV
jgi:hypothetical protein